MRILKILEQYRRDFTAEFECEHCGQLETKTGYDDDNFHQNVIPDMQCKACLQFGHKDYKPRATKYSPWEVV